MASRQFANWWAAQAMIASTTYINSITAGSRYQQRGPIGISEHGEAEHGAPFKVVFLALEGDPELVASAIREYTDKPRLNYVLDVFHEDRNPTTLADQYRSLGFDYRRTEAIYGVRLPQDKTGSNIKVHRLESMEELEYVNPELQREGEYISPNSLNDKHVRNYCAVLEGATVGWAQLVMLDEQAGFVSQLYTLTPYRRKGVGLALMDRIHSAGWKAGKKHILLIPSEIGKGLYAKYDYRPLLYFSAFRPTTVRE
ncbi:MAG TPA: GNAT family N-acetyltransferase [Anaerolineales bacterium]|nr:GNAT family N-acetyltransferase [Anaerolineales bacterium]